MQPQSLFSTPCSCIAAQLLGLDPTMGRTAVCVLYRTVLSGSIHQSTSKPPFTLVSTSIMIQLASP